MSAAAAPSSHFNAFNRAHCWRNNMAKQPEIIERFRVWAEVPKEQLGEVIVAFTRLGLHQIGHELITDTLSFKNKKKFDVNAQDFLRAWMQEHPTFTRTEVGAAFSADGRTDGSSYTAITRLRESGEIRALGNGNYQRKGVKAIEPPKEAKNGAAVL